MTEQVHQPTTVYTGLIRCVERDCPDYLTAGGYDNEAIENCSHLTPRLVCKECSPYDDDAGFIITTVAWPCPDTPDPLTAPKEPRRALPPVPDPGREARRRQDPPPNP